MISIVVSTYKPEAFSSFERSVAETIGVKYEIVKINNPGKMGLCEAYNLGIKNAKYPYICFSHDDILFHTKDWGKILIDIFERDSRLGLVGVAGSSYKSWMPSGWAAPQMEEFPKANFLQRIDNHSSLIFANPKSEILSQVVTLDGCWFCAKKEVTQKYKFDDSTFKNYHCYDLDYCFNAGQEYNIGVTYEILLEHLSQGSYNKDWVNESIKLHKKWSSKLPRSCETETSEDIFNQELIAFNEWIKRIKVTKYEDKFDPFGLYFSKKFYSILGLIDWIIFPIEVFIHYIKKAFVKLQYKLKIKK